jgi:chemotaxis signal transduction protein
MAGEATLLTFALYPERYGLPVDRVDEVVPLPELTPLPDSDPCVAGLFNLRGEIVTVIDLRARLGLPVRPRNLKNAVIIGVRQKRRYGLAVDEALFLIQASRREMDSPAGRGPGTDGAKRFIATVALHDGRPIPIIDFDRVVALASGARETERALSETKEQRHGDD